MSIFSGGEWQQYQRHIQLENVGVNGQQRLKNARILIVGAGGLGCPVAMYLGGAGVGHITIVDGDSISQTNLHRQLLFGYEDIGKLKAQVAAKRLTANNQFISVSAINETLSSKNVDELVAKVDIVLDCTDNFATRLLINDACVIHQTPWIYASVLGLQGQLALFMPKKSCFRCVFPEIPNDIPDCNAAGVLTTLPGLLGLLQANCCLHFLLDQSKELEDKLQIFNGNSNQIRTINLRKNEQCICCRQTIKPDKQAARQEQMPMHKTCVINPDIGLKENVKNPWQLSPEMFVYELRKAEKPFLLDVRSESEHHGFNIGGHCLSLNKDFIRDFAQICADRTLPVFVYCQSGIRSQRVVEALQSAQYHQVYNLQGGLGALLSQNNALKKMSKFSKVLRQ